MAPPSAQAHFGQYQADRPLVVNGPLFWLGRRLAKTRERLGLHYPSDSSAGDISPAALWDLPRGAEPAPCVDVRALAASPRAPAPSGPSDALRG